MRPCSLIMVAVLFAATPGCRRMVAYPVSVEDAKGPDMGDRGLVVDLPSLDGSVDGSVDGSSERVQLDDGRPADAAVEAALGEGGVVALACGGLKTGLCDIHEPPCFSGELLCSCERICSGIPLPPGSEHAWACKSPPDGRCPKVIPKLGEVCVHPGVICRYPTCGETTAVCKNGAWFVDQMVPPPGVP